MLNADMCSKMLPFGYLITKRYNEEDHQYEIYSSNTVNTQPKAAVMYLQPMPSSGTG